MLPPSADSLNVLARIRRWFGLRQDELAEYLGVSPVLVHSIETSRRGLSQAVGAAMIPLARQLPNPIALLDAPLPAGLPLDAPAPDAGELDFRRRVCLQRADRLRAQAGKLARQAHLAQRWQQALPALLPPPDAPDAEQAAWLTRWLHRRARPLSVEDVTRWHRLLAQA
ncbi:helix-turn-helix domain-containing protein, partial [Hymenobacter persicinus]